jgi:hypothetical protein
MTEFIVLYENSAETVVVSFWLHYSYLIVVRAELYPAFYDLIIKKNIYIYIYNHLNFVISHSVMLLYTYLQALTQCVADYIVQDASERMGGLQATLTPRRVEA